MTPIEAAAKAIAEANQPSGYDDPVHYLDDAKRVIAAYLAEAATPIRWCERHDAEMDDSGDDPKCWIGNFQTLKTPCVIVDRLLVEP